MSVIGLWKVNFDPAGGRLQSMPVEHDSSLDMLSRTLPAGAYTTLRTFNRIQALRLQDHLERLLETAELAGAPVQIDLAVVREALRQVVQHTNAPGDLRLRLQLDLHHNLGEVYIMAEPLRTPSLAAYAAGVKIVTAAMQRQTPKAKLTRFIERSSPLRRTLAEDINEALMIDSQGRILEGLTSNFFGVLDGMVWTAEDGVLPGITRSLTLECAARSGVTVRLEALRRADIPALSEAFITSSSRAVLPVRQIDAHPLTAPGPLTEKLAAAYQETIHNQAQDI